VKIQNYAHAQTKNKDKKLSFTECLNRQADDNIPKTSVESAVDQVSFSEALKLARPEDQTVTSSDRLNPASDALLLNLVDKLPRSLAGMTWNAVKRWVHHGEKSPEVLARPFQPGKQAPLRSPQLMESLQAVMNECPEYEPHIGKEHIWSRESKGHRGWGYFRRAVSAAKGERPFPFPTMGSSKLLCALGLGATAAVMPTGRESKLKSWIKKQEKGSVQLHTLFKEAYKMNKGDLYGTLLTAENVLSEGLYSVDRQNREITSKLSYLRNDSAPNGDNFGSWYHLFGSALFSLVRPEWKAHTAMKIESAGSYILEGRDPQEHHINKLGVELGVGLREVTESGLQEKARIRDYVNRSEFGWKEQNTAVWSQSVGEL
jgi:hypothetical protein